MEEAVGVWVGLFVMGDDSVGLVVAGSGNSPGLVGDFVVGDSVGDFVVGDSVGDGAIGFDGPLIGDVDDKSVSK